MSTKEYGADIPIVFRRVKPEDIDKLCLFDCGNRSINHFIKNECLNTSESVTYLFVNENYRVFNYTRHKLLQCLLLCRARKFLTLI